MSPSNVSHSFAVLASEARQLVDCVDRMRQGERFAENLKRALESSRTIADRLQKLEAAQKGEDAR